MSDERMEYWKVALDGVIARFPHHTDTIKAFYEGSPTFREICADHQEIAAWLEKHCRSQEHPSPNCGYAAEVLSDLEVEIIDCLEKKNKPVNDEIKWSGKMNDSA